MLTYLVALFMAVVVAGVPQGAEPQVRILDPTNDTYMMGPYLMRADVTPPAEVRHMTFFADGHVICRVEQPPFECVWNAGALTEHTVLVEALLTSGRRIRASVKTRSAVDPLNENVDRVLVTVSVLDGDRFVRGLPHSAFTVYEDNVRQKTDFFRAEDSTLEVVIAVDISESMSEALPSVKENVKRFLSQLRPGDSATVGAFNERYYLVAPPSTDRSMQLRKVDQLAPWGMTSLYDVVLRSFDQLSGKPGRRALVIFTDGEDTSSRVPSEAVEKRVSRNDATLYVIGQGKARQSRELRALCERLATRSGGKAFFPADRDLTGVAAAFDSITEELSNQYLLTYEPRSIRRDGRLRKFRVAVAGGYEVRHAEGYVPK